VALVWKGESLVGLLQKSKAASSSSCSLLVYMVYVVIAPGKIFCLLICYL
jgi:hypothetical protein